MGKTKIEELKIESIVLDFRFYPRLAVDDVHVRRLTEALLAGRELPPIIVEAGGLRCADGFHRISAARRAGRETVQAEIRTYKSDTEFLLDSIRMNANHGRPLAHAECLRATILADELGISRAVVADCLGVREEILDVRMDRRTAFGAAGRIPLKPSLRYLHGERLTEDQERANAHSGGHQSRYYARMLCELLRADAIDRSDDVLMSRLQELSALLSDWIARTEAAA